MLATIRKLSPVFKHSSKLVPTQEPERTFSDYWKVCQHCRHVYKSMHATTQHCLPCCSCGKHKKIQEMYGKAKGYGYVCYECSCQYAYLREMHYTILLRL